MRSISGRSSETTWAKAVTKDIITSKTKHRTEHTSIPILIGRSKQCEVSSSSHRQNSYSMFGIFIFLHSISCQRYTDWSRSWNRHWDNWSWNFHPSFCSGWWWNWSCSGKYCCELGIFTLEAKMKQRRSKNARRDSERHPEVAGFHD